MKTMKGETNMNIEEQTITVSFNYENFDAVINKLEVLDAILRETIDSLKETRNNSFSKSQVF